MPAWMMSSEISTETASLSFRAWHVFVLAGLVGATVAVVIVQPTETASLVLLVLAVGAGSYVGFGIYRAVLPLVSTKFSARIETVGGRTRAALDREKTLVLRAIKELRTTLHICRNCYDIVPLPQFDRMVRYVNYLNNWMSMG